MFIIDAFIQQLRERGVIQLDFHPVEGPPNKQSAQYGSSTHGTQNYVGNHPS